MSKHILELEREIFTNERPSVYDMFDNKNQLSSRKTILHRIIIVSKLRNFSNKARLGEYYDKMFRTQQQQQQQQQEKPKQPNPFNEKATGIIIIYPTLMIHVVESSLETIKDLLVDMEAMHQDPEGMIAESRILNFAHEIHIRLFPIYTFKIMNLTLEHDSSEPADSVETLVNDMIVRLLRLGKFLNDQAKTQLKKETIDNLHDQHPEFLPNQNYANYLIKSDELMTANEYLSYYSRPYNITLESELSWPAPSKLFPYQ